MPTAVSTGPRSAVRRLGGLGGLNKKQTGQFTPLPKRQVNSCCDNPIFEQHDNSKICMSCGTQISEQNIVAEVTFGETSTGAATVQGGYVGENSRSAKNVGGLASRRIGGQYQSREETEANGKRELRALCPQLHVAQNVEDVAYNLWRLAAMQNFIQGRRTAEVAGVCLYAACRRDKHNTVLLMDISEALHVNVFRLGDIYKELNKALYLEVHTHIQPIVDVEPLLFKYANELEFGDKTRQVAEDAARIVRRMKRDWMVTGRHPAGLCGACIILAARMNNFRRTVREVVFVVKVADMTIANRLAEFKRTRSSAMSVQDFRSKAMQLKVQHDPPSVSAAADRQKRLESILRRREERKTARESVDLTDVDTPAPSSRQSSVSGAVEDAAVVETRSTKRRRTSQAQSADSEPRIDADGFAIPARPVADSASTPPSTDPDDANTAPILTKKRGRPPKSDAPVVPLTDSDFAQENELEDEIEEILQDPECVSSRNDTEREKLESRARAVAEQQRAFLIAKEQASGRERPAISDSVEIGEDEFADDPEVQNALLSDDQVKVKEKIWVAHNEDWLRSQQAKQLKRAMDEAEGKTGDKKSNGGGGRKKRGRMGDGTVLTEGGTPVASPADATARMLEKRAPKGFSKSIDYAALNRIMGGVTSTSTPNESRAASVAPSPAPSGDDHVSTDAAIDPAPPAEVQHDIVQSAAEAAEVAAARVDRVASGLESGSFNTATSTTTVKATTEDGEPPGGAQFGGEETGQAAKDTHADDDDDADADADAAAENMEDDDDDLDDDDDDEEADFDDALGDTTGRFGVDFDDDDDGEEFS